MPGVTEFMNGRARNRNQGLLSSSSRCSVPHHGLTLPVEPHLPSNPVISVIRVTRWSVCLPFQQEYAEASRHPCSPCSICWEPLGNCDLELSMETHFLAGFPLDREKTVSCQDIWGGTENTLYFPDVILSACLSHGTCREGCHWLCSGLWRSFAGRTISSSFDCSLSNKVSLKHSLPFHPEEVMVWKLV